MKSFLIFALVIILLGVLLLILAVDNIDASSSITSTCVMIDDQGNITLAGELQCQYRVYLNLLGVNVTPNMLYDNNSFPCQGVDCPPAPINK